MCLRCVQREQRHRPSIVAAPTPTITAAGLYPPVANTLILGDGDLSFSLALCRKLKALQKKKQKKKQKQKQKQKPSFSNTTSSLRIVATTYLTKEQLHRTYPATASNNVKKLIKCGVEPVHGVDATILGTEKCQLTLGGHAGRRRYHRVIWNFPCVHSPIDAVDQDQRGRDGQNEEMEDNKRMLKLFFSKVIDLLVPGGEVHLVHKTKPPYNQWDIEEQVGDSGMKLAGAIVFDREQYPGYINRKALVGRGSFPISDARTFVFVAPLILRPSPDILSIHSTFQQLNVAKEKALILVDDDMLTSVCGNLIKKKRESSARGGGGSSSKKRRKK